jgi:hypothetical protein
LNLFIADKQQDVTEFKVDSNDKGQGQESTSQPSKNARDKKAPMSHISGVRKLKHTNSFAGVVPKYGIETPNEEELGEVGVA